MGKTNFKDKWKSLVEKHGKKKIYGGISAIVLVLLLCIFGIIWSMTSTPKTQSNDPLDHVTGIRNWKIVVDTEDVDFMQGVEWDEKYINEVTVESEEVDLTKIGEYTITYVIDVKDSKKDVEEDRTVEVISKDEEKEKKESEDEKKDKESKDKEKEESKESSNSDSKDSSKKPDSKKELSSSNTSSSSKPSHTHSWQPQYTTVHHDAVYEQKYVVDQAAWSEERSICNQCGADITGNYIAHFKASPSCSGYHSEIINHPEQGHYENVQVSAAWDEQVLTGYKCSCGATK
ncbi:hypothetical protein [Faecalicoccus acidiformans]|uniref:hypothetical protein n=1 Tax=Faecalicoccus acidiformans TaxID=915173 RepID=UPI003208ECEB